MELKQGSRGQEIKDLQILINQYYGSEVLIPDGVFGPKTTNVIKKFQKENSLVPDGIVGPKTMQALQKTSVCHGCSIKKSKRSIQYLIVHCSATPQGREVSCDTIRKIHIQQRGWRDIGYHYLIHLDGSIECGRDVDQSGAHTEGYNSGSIGICYIGGTDLKGKPLDTRTPEQKEALLDLLKDLKTLYPEALIKGHRDFSPDKNKNGIIEPSEYIKACPCFDASQEYKNL